SGVRGGNDETFSTGAGFCAHDAPGSLPQRTARARTIPIAREPFMRRLRQYFAGSRALFSCKRGGARRPPFARPAGFAAGAPEYIPSSGVGPGEQSQAVSFGVLESHLAIALIVVLDRRAHAGPSVDQSLPLAVEVLHLKDKAQGGRPDSGSGLLDSLDAQS